MSHTMKDLQTMTDLQLLKKENKNLKDLLSQVCDVSCLFDMIEDGIKDRDDDEALGYNLILKSQIEAALHDPTKRLKNLMTDEPIKFTNDNKPIKIRSN